jgi:hypothetical protein
MVAVTGCLLLSSCDHEKTTTKDYDRFVMTKVMSYNNYLGLSSLVSEKMCRNDNELCIKCLNSNAEESFCDLRIYDDHDSDYLLYTDQRSLFHLVNSVAGMELECKNLDMISEHILGGAVPIWLDGERFIISSAKNLGSSFDPYRSSYVGYEVQLNSRPCVAREIWFYPANGYSSTQDLISPDRRGVAWIAYTEKKCLLRWFYDDYAIHEKDVNCDSKKFWPVWIGDHPEPSDKH